MWDMKYLITPVVIRAPGIVTKRLKEKFETFDKFTTKDSCTWNITHNTESTAV
jgi:hypothetical protein